ncbi:hypothetical protein SUGI_0422150 [Cryptomeria japonica]|nr:hypothetical protein SUGI_0422150 [Cryptomeria japonica]
MRGTSRSSRTISKLKFGGSIAQQSHNTTRIIRIVHITPAEVIRTDPAHFRALVQKLTGRHSTHSSIKSKHKKLNLPVSPESHESTGLHHSQNPIDDLSNELGKREFMLYEDKFMASLPEIKQEPLDDERARLCHNLSGFFGGFEELDIFSSLLDSSFGLPDIH